MRPKQTTANLDDILRSIIFDFILKIVMSKLVERFAFLGWPIINPLIGMVLGWFAQEMFEQLSKFFRFQAIDSQIAKEVEGYSEAIEGLKAALAVPSDDVERESLIDEAKDAYKARLAELIRIRPIA